MCAQRDDEGTLTLILEPSQQPTYDFPAISYFLYKGVEPASILTNDGTNAETSHAGANQLVGAVKAAWELPSNQDLPSTPPPKACLGLHLTPTDYPLLADQPRFADSKSLDNLFHEGDPAIQLPLVRSGFRLGDFSTSLPFGLEILGPMMWQFTDGVHPEPHTVPGISGACHQDMFLGADYEKYVGG